MEIFIFFLILSVLVLVHEMGHLIMAKGFKMRVEEFGIGLPPRAKKLFTKGGTLFSLNWLPIGGFVRLYGEDFENEEQSASPEAFFNKPLWQRAGVLVAGVVMNFVLGVILFAVVYSFLGIPVKTDKVLVDGVVSGSPAAMSGLVEGDQIIGISYQNEIMNFENVDSFIKRVGENKGREISLSLKNKQGEIREMKITPRLSPPAGEGALGVTLTGTEIVHYPSWQMPFRGMVVGLEEAVSWGKEITANMINLFGQILSGKGAPKDVAGPVGIYQATKSVYKYGILAVLQFMGVLSINLAIMNIMPFPALDGGRLFFLGVEKVIGKKLKNKIEGYVHTGGMVFLLGLMVLITVRDVLRLMGRV